MIANGHTAFALYESVHAVGANGVTQREAGYANASQLWSNFRWHAHEYIKLAIHTDTVFFVQLIHTSDSYTTIMYTM